MPARNSLVTLPAGVWTQITDGDVTACRVQNVGSDAVWIQGRVGAGSISSNSGAVCLSAMMAILGDMTLAQIFPGIAGANRVYAWSERGSAVSVSHA